MLLEENVDEEINFDDLVREYGEEVDKLHKLAKFGLRNVFLTFDN